MGTLDEEVAVWTESSGAPARMLWRAQRFRVTDTPTTLVDTCGWWDAFGSHRFDVGHQPLCIAGWRFQATSGQGPSRVFDVRHDAVTDRWRLMRVFD